jgi:hypothetical protein
MNETVPSGNASQSVVVESSNCHATQKIDHELCRKVGDRPKISLLHKRTHVRKQLIVNNDPSGRPWRSFAFHRTSSPVEHI